MCAFTLRQRARIFLLPLVCLLGTTRDPERVTIMEANTYSVFSQRHIKLGHALHQGWNPKDHWIRWCQLQVRWELWAIPNQLHLFKEQHTNLMEVRETYRHVHLYKPLGAYYFSRSYHEVVWLCNAQKYHRVV